ncbi:hypothetical protein SMGES_11870 [Serratia marcescens]|nr:hypothetical protein SMGES_11870 [Serratia marcescens]
MATTGQAQNDAIAGLDTPDIFAGAHDHSRSLVAKNHWRRHRYQPIMHSDIRMAKACGDDLYQNFIVPGIIKF